jgi:transcriptional regulator with XRE-family HTH domain
LQPHSWFSSFITGHQSLLCSIPIEFTALREEAGVSQKELADRLDTTQQQISRLESPAHEGHSLSMLRRVARALNASVRVVFETKEKASASRVAEQPPRYRTKRRRSQFFLLTSGFSSLLPHSAFRN